MSGPRGPVRPAQPWVPARAGFLAAGFVAEDFLAGVFSAAGAAAPVRAALWGPGPLARFSPSS